METTPQNRYACYGDYSMRIHPDGSFECMYAGRGAIAPRVTFVLTDGAARRYTVADYAVLSTEWAQPWYGARVELTLQLRSGGAGLPDVNLRCTLTRDGMELAAETLPEGYTVGFQGALRWGTPEDCFAVALDRPRGARTVLRAAVGTAAAACDNALLDRATGDILRISGEKARVSAQDEQTYAFETTGTVQLGVVRDYYARRFQIPYGPVQPSSEFDGPPSGWMTWYAVRFDACEQAVLENAALQQKLLKPYGANTVWVDWEWYHSGLPNPQAPDTIGYFSPDPVRYPHGMAYVAEKIREMGFTPALWVGPTNEPAKTEFMREFADAVYAEHLVWCGKYFFDITDERYVDELIPRAFSQVKAWGYGALKWDCLPMTAEVADRYHDSLRHPEISTDCAMRRLITRARQTVGQDFYMLSCSGEIDRTVFTAGDLFHAARIGGDVFDMREFMANTVRRLVHLYPFHNVLFYCDPDNVVLRPEYNTVEQARSRISLIALLGLPVTFGDDLRTLPADRIDMLRRALPPLPVHPMDVWEDTFSGGCLTVHLTLHRDFETWHVVDVFNTEEEAAQATVSLREELMLEAGRYLVYDFWNRRLVAITDDVYTLSLAPQGSGVCAVRRLTGRPQIASTTRHISQGVPDLIRVSWDEAQCVLEGVSHKVAGDDYRLMIYVPETFRPLEGTVREGILEYRTSVEAEGQISWRVAFERV